MDQTTPEGFKLVPKNNLLFWQPKTDYYLFVSRLPFGKSLVIFLNYSIWLFMAYWSALLIKADINYFGRLFVITVLAEIIEKVGKSLRFWPRPFYYHHHSTPSGLIDRWYKTGSLPSGHTIKATYFLLFLIQTQVFSPLVFLIIVVPLILYRILIGFHYPIDVLIGIVIGILLWLAFNTLVTPPNLVVHFATFFNWFFSLLQ
ncbi:MAG: phosphatase PAP2 family protein [Candidatus Shapirobacteria bacterium]